MGYKWKFIIGVIIYVLTDVGICFHMYGNGIAKELDMMDFPIMCGFVSLIWFVLFGLIWLLITEESDKNELLHG